MDSGGSTTKQFALRFVLIIGVVQLFADMTYEGARGIIGPFLGSLGASATVVGFTAGFGELMGYAFRSVTGYFADKTHKYWVFIFAGYLVNMLAVPALALAGHWPLADECWSWPSGPDAPSGNLPRTPCCRTRAAGSATAGRSG